MGAVKSFAATCKQADPRLFGHNGSEILAIEYAAVSPHARQVVNKIKRSLGKPPEKFWDPARDGKTAFQNKSNDLPAGGTYVEYTVLQTSADYTTTYETSQHLVGSQHKAKRKQGREGADAGGGDMPHFDAGLERIVHDTASGRLYYTPSHYQGETDSTGPTAVYYNPFFLIVAFDPGSELRHGPGF